MDFAALVPAWLDAFLIAPFRWPASAEAGLWLGSALLAFYSLVLGELISALVYLWHRRRLEAMQAEVLRYHNLSVDAIHAGDKQAYLAINKMAHDEFGKSFFAQAGPGTAAMHHCCRFSSWSRYPLMSGYFSCCALSILS